MKRTNGFTFIELMVTIALVAVITTVAVPAWSDFIRRNQAAAETNELITSLNYTRSEAVRRNTEVSLCRSHDGATCDGDQDWTAGWIAYIGGTPSSPDTVLREWTGRDNGSELTGPENGLTYNPDGSLDNAAAFDSQPRGCTGHERRQIALSLAGRPRTDKAQCDHGA
jgi:type IV fimbrial biogenesis protein FimT